jgi:hypothetical protein
MKEKITYNSRLRPMDVGALTILRIFALTSQRQDDSDKPGPIGTL